MLRLTLLNNNTLGYGLDWMMGDGKEKEQGIPSQAAAAAAIPAHFSHFLCFDFFCSPVLISHNFSFRFANRKKKWNIDEDRCFVVAPRKWERMADCFPLFASFLIIFFAVRFYFVPAAMHCIVNWERSHI